MNYVKFFAKANTATAATVFASTVKGESNLITRLVNLGYVAGNTVHNLTLFRPVGTATLAANFAANGTSLTLSGDPSAAYNSTTKVGLRQGLGTSAVTAIGNNTFGIVQGDNGESALVAITAWNGTTKVATVTAGAAASPSYAATSGNNFWYCGAVADIHNVNLRPQANTRTQYNPGNHVGIFGSSFHGDPLAIYSDNATAAGFMECSGGYIKTAGG